MARTRYLKPTFFTDTTLGELSLGARYLYAGLWTMMDCRGLCESNARLIKAAVFPHDDAVTATQVEVLTGELAGAGRILRFTAEGRSWLLGKKLAVHQTFHRDEVPKYLKWINDEVLDRCQHGVDLGPAPVNASAYTTLNPNSNSNPNPNSNINLNPNPNSAGTGQAPGEHVSSGAASDEDDLVRAEAQVELDRLIARAHRGGPGLARVL